MGHEKKEEMTCRDVISLLFNGCIDSNEAKKMLESFSSKTLTEVILDTFNRVDGCFALNETFVEEK